MNVTETVFESKDISDVDTSPCTLSLKLQNISHFSTQILDLSKMLSETSINQVFDNMDLSTITDLSLAANNVCSLPLTFTQNLSNLTHLNLSQNCLTDLPQSINLLKNIQYLNINDNQFIKLPLIIGELTSLKTLKASKNAITELSDALSSLVHLEDLDLSSNQLCSLPVDYEKLEHVKNLSLAENSFTEIPKCILYGMRSLEMLDLSKNCGCKLEAQPFTSRLKIFRANDNLNCSSFPKWILSFKCSQLREVSLNNTWFKIYDFPTIPFESHIRILSMEQSSLFDSVLEKLLSGMAYLEQLLVGNSMSTCEGNVFCSMPFNRLQNPSRLKVVGMQKTGLPLVPNNINRYMDLIKIDLSGNDITWLPNEFCQLNKLESIILDTNSLNLLPADIGQLRSLKELKASHNSLCQLPDSLKDLNNLQFVDLYDNDFSSMPTIITNLKNLSGLDFEQNFFSTEDLVIKDTPYEILRECLRKRYYDNEKILGFKIEDYASTDYDSRSSESDEYFARNCSPPITSNKTMNNDILVEENWDESGHDTDNDFDPTENKYISTRTELSSLCVPQEHLFCPSDIHQRRVRDRAREAFEKGLLIFPDIVEGQFDDAD